MNRFFTIIGLIALLVFSMSQFLVTSVVSARIVNISFAIWLTCILITEQGRHILAGLRYRWFYAFIAMIFLFTSVEQGIIKAIISVMVLCQVASPILMFDYYKLESSKVRTIVIAICIVLLCINCYLSLSIFELNGGRGLRAIRATDIAFYNAFNIVYSITVLVPLFVYIFFRNKEYKGNKVIHFLLIAIAIFFAYIIYRSYFVTALIITITASIVGIFYGKKKWAFRSAVAIIASLVLFLSSYSIIINFIEDTSKESSHIVIERLDEVRSVFSGNRSSAVDFNERQDLRALSWHTFLEHPLCGVYPQSKSFLDAELEGVGHHAEWTDLLAMYGILAVLLFIFLVKSVIRTSKDVGGYFFIFPYVAIGFFNPVFFFEQNYVAFFIAPLLLTVIDQKNRSIF